jgi:hypothetical protein
MAVWKIIVYPSGFVLVSLILLSFAGRWAFGPDPSQWLEWQNRLADAVGAAGGLSAFVSGMYVAMKANARLFP